MLQELDEILNEWVEEDDFSKMKEKIYSKALTGRLDRPHYLLSQHPLLCGTLLLDIRIRLQDAGIHTVNPWGSIICGALFVQCGSTGWVSSRQVGGPGSLHCHPSPRTHLRW